MLRSLSLILLIATLILVSNQFNPLPFSQRFVIFYLLLNFLTLFFSGALWSEDSFFASFPVCSQFQHNVLAFHQSTIFLSIHILSKWFVFYFFTLNHWLVYLFSSFSFSPSTSLFCRKNKWIPGPYQTTVNNGLASKTNTPSQDKTNVRLTVDLTICVSIWGGSLSSLGILWK